MDVPSALSFAFISADPDLELSIDSLSSLSVEVCRDVTLEDFSLVTFGSVMVSLCLSSGKRTIVAFSDCLIGFLLSVESNFSFRFSSSLMELPFSGETLSLLCEEAPRDVSKLLLIVFVLLALSSLFKLLKYFFSLKNLDIFLNIFVFFGDCSFCVLALVPLCTLLTCSFENVTDSWFLYYYLGFGSC